MVCCSRCGDLAIESKRRASEHASYLPQVSALLFASFVLTATAATSGIYSNIQIAVPRGSSFSMDMEQCQLIELILSTNFPETVVSMGTGVVGTTCNITAVILPAQGGQIQSFANFTVGRMSCLLLGHSIPIVCTPCCSVASPPSHGIIWHHMPSHGFVVTSSQVYMATIPNMVTFYQNMNDQSQWVVSAAQPLA